MKTRTRSFFLCVFFLLMILACSFPGVEMQTRPNFALTITSQALGIEQTRQASSQPQPQNQSQQQAQPPAGPSATPNSAPAVTSTPSPSATPEKPQVINDTLCSVGPGEKYEVVSALKRGEVVEIIGRGSIDGWLIIRNPRYNDPCWVSSKDLKVDASFDLNSLKIFNPPPDPTKTPKPTPIPSPTPV